MLARPEVQLSGRARGVVLFANNGSGETVGMLPRNLSAVVRLKRKSMNKGANTQSRRWKYGCNLCPLVPRALALVPPKRCSRSAPVPAYRTCVRRRCCRCPARRRRGTDSRRRSPSGSSTVPRARLTWTTVAGRRRRQRRGRAVVRAPARRYRALGGARRVTAGRRLHASQSACDQATCRGR